MSQPRILFVDHTGALGGAELYLLDVARHYRQHAKVLLFEEGPFQERLSRAGIEVDVLEAAASLHAIQKQDGLLGAMKAVPGLLDLSTQVARQARSYDVVYANSQKALVAAGPAAWWAERPLIWNLHDLLSADHFSPVNRQIAIRCANMFANRVIVNSKATGAAFAESGGRTPVKVVYNGLDAARFTPRPETQLRALRRNLGIDNAPLVGVFSRLAPWKGQHVLLEALTKLAGVHALLVGDALFDGDTSYAERLHHRATQLDIQNRVHFLGFRDDIPALMQLVDVVAHTSTAPEPFGRVIVEGMLAGTPVVATRAGGAREIIEHGKTGYLVEPGNAEALCAVIRQLLNDDAQAQTLAQAACSVAQNRFSKTGMLRRIDHEIDQVLS